MALPALPARGIIAAMSLRAFLFSLPLLAVFPVGAQVVTVKHLDIAASADADGPGWQTSVRLSVPAGMVERVTLFDDKKSTALEVTDSVSGQPVKVKTAFVEHRFMAGTMDDKDVNVNLTVTAPPEVPRSWLQVKGTLVFKSVVETKKHKPEIKLVDGTTFKAGDILLTVKDFREDGNSISFSLEREDGSLSPIYDLRFADAEGNPVQVDRRGGGSSSRNGKIISESWRLGCPAGLETLHAEFEMVGKEEDKEVPFDIVVPVNP
ncbi:MAG: hypothetical protein ACKO2G_16345 [Verrucomicrobiales bacterium]